VLNREVIQSAYEALQARTGATRFQWVKGHNGHTVDSAVDKLASNAARSPKIGALAGPGWARTPVTALALPEPQFTLDLVQGIDSADPAQQLADELVSAPEGMLEELIVCRMANGLLIKEVVEKLGLVPAAVQNTETRVRNPELSLLRRYAHAVGVGLQIKVVPTH
jgi:hypothetical protein